jgi:hypothetical protein
MPGFFEALNNFKKPQFNTVYYLKIKGKEIDSLHMSPGEDHVVVDKQQYLQLLKEGQQNFYFIDGKVVKKPKRQGRRVFKVLEKSNTGLIFLDNDPYWPMDANEGGFQWQIPVE